LKNRHKQLARQYVPETYFGNIGKPQNEAISNHFTQHIRNALINTLPFSRRPGGDLGVQLQRHPQVEFPGTPFAR